MRFGIVVPRIIRSDPGYKTHGLPDAAAPSELLGYDTGQWKRTELCRDGVPHSFPERDSQFNLVSVPAKAGKLEGVPVETPLAGLEISPDSSSFYSVP